MVAVTPIADAHLSLWIQISLLVEILKDCEVVAPNWRNIKIPPGSRCLSA
jgi:hypothetical protein